MIMLAKAKKKMALPELKSRMQMEQCVGEIARLQIERDAVMCEMDAEILAIRAQYETRLQELGAGLEAEMDRAGNWAEANPMEFDGKKKSIEFTHGTAGFRTGTPKLKTLRGWTWDRVLEQLARMRLTDHIRTRSEVDKEKIIADRDTLADKLPLIGVTVVQEETFFVEVKREAVETAKA